jgi:hypothetical protein
MLLAATRRFGFALLLGLSVSLSVGCAGRWQPLGAPDVTTQVDQQAAYNTVLQTATAKNYVVVSKDDVGKKVRLQAQSNSKSFIDVTVLSDRVKLAPAGAFVRGDKVHKTLKNEVNNFEFELKQRFAKGGAAPAETAPAAQPAQPVADAGAAPAAWSEPAYDPSVWGNGNFTCLPVRVPPDHQAALSLQLSNGDKADLQLSLAYDQGLCRSPAQCRQPGGCPALGIGDAERVNRLAARLSRGEVGPKATLLDAGKPIATVDLAHHGSIVQALSEQKH